MIWIVLYTAATAYYVTLIVVKGHLFHNYRESFKRITPWLVKGPEHDRMHFIDCRLCVGTWVTPFSFIFYYFVPSQLPGSLFCGWALAYLLTTFERR